jgi:hypothetical protein
MLREKWLRICRKKNAFIALKNMNACVKIVVLNIAHNISSLRILDYRLIHALNVIQELFLSVS